MKAFFNKQKVVFIRSYYINSINSGFSAYFGNRQK